MSNSFDQFANTTNTETSANPFVDTNPFTADTPADEAEESSEETSDGSATDVVAKPKREMAPRLTGEQKRYILQNYHSDGIVEVAKKLEININQVRTTIKKTRKDLEALIETSTVEEDKAKFVKFIEEFLPPKVSVDSEGNVVKKRRGPAKDDTRSLVEEMLKGLSLG